MAGGRSELQRPLEGGFDFRAMKGAPAVSALNAVLVPTNAMANE